MSIGNVELAGREVHSGQQSEFLFTSSFRSIKAKGIHTKITEPAISGDAEGCSDFHSSISEALDRAKAAGIDNPIVIGAIPFDTTRPSNLYVPESHYFFDRNVESPTIGSGQLKLSGVLSAHSRPGRARFEQAVEQIRANFRFSDIRKTVLSRELELEFGESVDINQVLTELIEQNPAGYHYRVPVEDGKTLIGASPELLIQKNTATILSNPLAGSAKRNDDKVEDQVASVNLLGSAKDNYEHRLVIEDMRRILAPYCRTLQIPESPELINTPTMWHLSTPIRGELLDSQISALQLACKLHPTPAVCGFPTSDARKLIHLVEPFERGAFTGLVGWCDANGNGEWVITIRCGIVQDRKIRLFAGAGIVAGSCPESEWRETEAKLATMFNALGIPPQEVVV